MVFDQSLNPNPLVDSLVGYSLALGIIYTCVVSLTVIGLRNAMRAWGDNDLSVQFAVISLAGIVLLPASATYHFLLLSVPIGILLNVGERKWCLEQKILGLLYVGIGFLPYSFFRGFDGNGVLTILAYPRLFLTVGIFVVAASYVARFRPAHSVTQERIQVA
jgi:hypothetical protein